MDKNVLKKINELYILSRKKFLLMDESGYKTISNSKENKINLCDEHIRKHLLNKYTIGVFAGSIFSKFICFDVDVQEPQMAKMTVYSLVNTLQELGIFDEYINISLSGSKGYHVEIFFDKPVQNTLIKQFYLMVLNYAELLNLSYGKVELRPTDSQGVKMPLGKHFKSGNICWYVDYENGLKPIHDYKHILTIKQMDSEFFYNLINRANDRIDFSATEAQVIEDVIAKHKPLKIYQQNIDEDVTIEAIEELIKNGLTMVGTRHNSLIKIAKYNKHFGMNEFDNKQFLIKWMQQQDKRIYTTTWEDCIKDIDLIVKWVYESNCSLTIKKVNISVDLSEIDEILKVNGKNEKVVLYSLLIHSKRYGLNSGMFYMSYKQMIESTGLSERALIYLIEKLETNNIITVTRDTNIKYNNKLKKPVSPVNQYKINLLSAKLYNPENVNTFKVCDKKCQNCFSACLHSLLGKQDLKKKLTRREYESFTASLEGMVCVS